MKDFIKVIKALSEPNRVKILKMLQHRAMYVKKQFFALYIYCYMEILMTRLFRTRISISERRLNL